LLTSQFVYAYEWARIDIKTGTEDSKLYIDIDSIEQVTPLTSFWLHMKEPSGEYSVTKLTINCDTKEALFADKYDYDKDGNIITTSYSSTWMLIAPKSNGDFVYLLTCEGFNHENNPTIDVIKYKVKHFRERFLKNLTALLTKCVYSWPSG
jgi:hypothetical protein